MYVCVCHQVSDKDIHRAVDRGVDTLESLGKELNVATCCGRCADCAKQVLHEAKSNQISGDFGFQVAMA